MTIIHKPTFSKQLKEILEYIAKDKPSASMKFKNDLKESINLIPSNPVMYRKSIYFNDKDIRDMVHKGYTVTYRIRPLKQEIEILRIFNKKNQHNNKTDTINQRNQQDYTCDNLNFYFIKKV